MALNPAYRIELLERPGLRMSEPTLDALVEELRDVAGCCFDHIPVYQCLTGRREDLSNALIATARAPDGRLLGFCSSLLLDVEKVGTVLHLGLTCVRPEARRSKLTRRLMFRIVSAHYMRNRFMRRLWVSNVACVLSSLGNVALSFDGVYPSPFGLDRPTESHRAIARAIDQRYRQSAYIEPSAVLDEDDFVFRGSVGDTVFQKEEGDHRYRHRMPSLNDFYGNRMNFERGDEVLQIGYVTPLSFFRYARSRPRRSAALPVPAALPATHPVVGHRTDEALPRT